MALLAGGHHLNIRPAAVDAAHLKGVAARYEKPGTAIGVRGVLLHVARDTEICDGCAMSGTGNRLAVGDGVDAQNHIALRTIMRTKAGSAPISGQPKLIVYNVGDRRTVAAVMTLQAQ